MIGTLNEALMKGWGGGRTISLYGVLRNAMLRLYKRIGKTAKPIFKKFANVNLSMF